MKWWRWIQNRGRSGQAGQRPRRAERFGGESVRCELGDVADISNSGMRILCQGKPPVKRGGHVDIRLRFADGSLALRAQVRWSRRRGLKRYEIGLQFVQLKPGMHKVLDAIARYGMASVAGNSDHASPASSRPDPSGPDPASREQHPPRPPEVSINLPNYYEVLGVDPDATAAQIKARYRRLAVACHPDRADTPDGSARFKAINEAYHVLADSQRRESYRRMTG